MALPARVRLQHPTEFGPYELLEQLGQGGMAIVHRARLRGASGFVRDVVLKAMLPNLVSSAPLVEMFEAEARLTAQLRHTNIVQVEDYGVADGIPYLIMEYLDGRNLSQLRQALTKVQRRAPIPVAVTVARDLCLALGYAHHFVTADGERMQVIHRDVSPSNVMVQRDGTVKLLDFGVAKLWNAAGQVVTTSLKGKFAYMAPEQVNQEPIDRRCDVFAAGIVLHELLTGKRLFGSKNERETLRRVAIADASPPSEDNRDVPPELDRIVMRALQRKPENRYPSGVEMAAALDALGLAAGRRELARLVEEVAPRAAAAEISRGHVLTISNSADTDPHPIVEQSDQIFEDVTAPEQLAFDAPNDQTDAQKMIIPPTERPTRREMPQVAPPEKRPSLIYTGPADEFDARPTELFNEAPALSKPVASSNLLVVPENLLDTLASPPPVVERSPEWLPRRWLIPAAVLAIVFFAIGGTIVWRDQQLAKLREVEPARSQPKAAVAPVAPPTLDSPASDARE